MADPLGTIHLRNTELEQRFAAKLQVNPRLSRQLVSFQANKNKPAYRWFKYKEGFSEALVQYYTRTYALELAMLGIGESELRNLRQTMVSCTVENKEKRDLDRRFSKQKLIFRWTMAVCSSSLMNPT